MYSPGLAAAATSELALGVADIGGLPWRIRLLTPRSAADERPAAQRADCLWLLDFSPDQVHRSPLRGPLIGSRSWRIQDDVVVVRAERASVKGGVKSGRRRQTAWRLRFPPSSRLRGGG